MAFGAGCGIWGRVWHLGQGVAFGARCGVWGRVWHFVCLEDLQNESDLLIQCIVQMEALVINFPSIQF